MIIYRLANAQYKNDLSGTGSKLLGGRWNSCGNPAVYTTENISLAVLEMLARADKYTIPANYFLLKIKIPEIKKQVTITEHKLKKKWHNDFGYTRFMGDAFLKANTSLLLKVPSAIVPEENNFLINPLHSDFKKVRIIETSEFKFDKRLFLKHE